MVGGIVLPETAAERPTEGRVIAVGSGTLLDSGQRLPIDVKEGDTVVYGKYAGSEITLEGTDYKILSADDILAVREG